MLVFEPVVKLCLRLRPSRPEVVSVGEVEKSVAAVPVPTVVAVVVVDVVVPPVLLRSRLLPIDDDVWWPKPVPYGEARPPLVLLLSAAMDVAEIEADEAAEVPAPVPKNACEKSCGGASGALICGIAV